MIINKIECKTTPEKWVMELKKAFVDQAKDLTHTYLYLNKEGQIEAFSTQEEAKRQEFTYKLTSEDIVKLTKPLFLEAAKTEFSINDLYIFKHVYRVLHTQFQNLKVISFSFYKTLFFSSLPAQIQEEYNKIEGQLNIKTRNELVVLNQNFHQNLHDFHCYAQDYFDRDVCQESLKKFKENWFTTYNNEPKNSEEWKSHIEELNKKINALSNKIQAVNSFGGTYNLLNNPIDCKDRSLWRKLVSIKERVFSSLDHDEEKLKKDIQKLSEKIKSDSSEVDLSESEELKFFHLTTPDNLNESSVMSPDSLLGSIGSIGSPPPSDPFSPITPTESTSIHKSTKKFEYYTSKEYPELTPQNSQMNNKINNTNNDYISSPLGKYHFNRNFNNDTRIPISLKNIQENLNNSSFSPLTAKGNNNNNNNIRTPIRKNNREEDLNDSPFNPKNSKEENSSG